MTTQEFTEFIYREFSEYTIKDLKIYARTFHIQNSKTGDLAKEVIMEILFEKMTREEFVEFCNEL
jgi:hypothetical protein